MTVTLFVNRNTKQKSRPINQSNKWCDVCDIHPKLGMIELEVEDIITNSLPYVPFGPEEEITCSKP